MINSLRAEFRKLLTVRSTYVLSIIAILLSVFLSFYVFGINTRSFEAGNQYRTQDSVFFILNNTLFFTGIVSLLLFTHEYRYNTISYTLTSAKNRFRVLMTKSIVVSVFAVVLGALIVFFTLVFSKWGLSLSGANPVDQIVDFGQIIWRAIFGSAAIAMFGLIMGGIIRNQIGTIATYFIAPGTMEGLLGLVLKDNTAYLPFSALNQVMFAQTGQTTLIQQPLSPGKSALIVCIYIVVFWLLTLYLLNRRDAN